MAFLIKGLQNKHGAEWVEEKKSKIKKKKSVKKKTDINLAALSKSPYWRNDFGCVRRCRGTKPLKKGAGFIYDAWEVIDSKHRVALARKALEISPVCRMPYVLLAEEAASSLSRHGPLPKRCWSWWTCSRREAFEEDLVTSGASSQPVPICVLRRAGRMSWTTGSARKAWALQGMLRLNPMTIRHPDLLMPVWLRWAKIKKPKPSSGNTEMMEWLHGSIHGPCLISKDGGFRNSRKSLKVAVRKNKYVQLIFWAAKKCRNLPEYYSHGDESEAIFYTRKIWSMESQHRELWTGCSIRQMIMQLSIVDRCVKSVTSLLEVKLMPVKNPESISYWKSPYIMSSSSWQVRTVFPFSKVRDLGKRQLEIEEI